MALPVGSKRDGRGSDHVVTDGKRRTHCKTGMYCPGLTSARSNCTRTMFSLAFPATSSYEWVGFLGVLDHTAVGPSELNWVKIEPTFSY